METVKHHGPPRRGSVAQEPTTTSTPPSTSAPLYSAIAGPQGPQGERGPAGPPGEAVVKTLRLWVAIIALTTALLTGIGLAGSQIVNLKHQIDQIQQTSPQK